MFRIEHFIALLTSSLSIGSVLAAQLPIQTEAGALLGTHEDGVATFKGIPYARAPVGALRWRDPQPVAPWQGVRRAEAFAPACPQKGVSMPGELAMPTSEDCLYLNLWKPDTKEPGPLPVMVWIHGGGFVNGSASNPLYWGDRLAHQGVIVVSIAYRLGALGFLAHPELSLETAKNSSGNYGLKDQIAALEWVQRNIAAFGGDPDRVTIAGQSSGAMSVSALMVSPRAAGLFHRAIGQSGGLFEPVQLAPDYKLANAEVAGSKLMSKLGAANLQQMRDMPVERLLGSAAASLAHPVIEPEVLPMAPYDAYIAGRAHDVPILIGSNADEARSLTDVRQVKAATFVSELTKAFGPLPPPLYAAYTYNNDVEAGIARLEFERDLRFGWDMWTWARLQAARRKPVYYYSFDHAVAFPKGSSQENWGGRISLNSGTCSIILGKPKRGSRTPKQRWHKTWHGIGLISYVRETRTARRYRFGRPIAEGLMACFILARTSSPDPLPAWSG